MVFRAQLAAQTLDQRCVVGDELTFDASLLLIAERIETGAAQRLAAREQPEEAQHPLSVAALARTPCTVPAREERRGQIHPQTVVADELLPQRLLETAVAVQARDLVFVLVSQQLCIVAGHRLRQAVIVRVDALFRLAHALDGFAVAFGIADILIVGQMRGTMIDDFCQRIRLARARIRAGSLRRRAGIVRAATSPGEGAFVGVDGHTVQLDGPFQRLRRERQQTFLIREPEHEQIRGDSVPAQCRCQLRGVDEMRLTKPHGIGNRGVHRAVGKVQIA